MTSPSPSEQPPPSLRGEWPWVAAVAAWFGVVFVLTGAWRDVPVIDDWTYAWSVEQLLRHGQLRVLDWSAVYPLGHAVWGAGWSAAFGFSFVTLRVSTLALAAVACGATYFLLRELQTPPRVAMLGVATLAVSPVFVLLSSSFMTDVPFVAFTLLALLGYVRAIQRGDARWVWWAGLWACLSCLDRQVGVLTPVAAVPLLVWPPQGVRRRSVVSALVVTWGAMIVGAVAIGLSIGATGEMRKLADALGWLQSLPLRSYAAYTFYVLTSVAFYVLPALLPLALHREAWRRGALAIAAVVAGVAVFGAAGEVPVPLRPNGTWTLRELGGARQLVAGEFPLGDLPWLVPVLRAAGLFALAVAGLAVWRAARAIRGGVALRTLDPRTPVLVYLVAYLALVNVLWFFNDRYVLVLLPVAIVLGLSSLPSGRAGVRLGGALAAAYAVVAIVGTRDTLRFNDEVRAARQALVDGGVALADIDAGYVWNGWTLYAHPENLHPGQTADDVPWITARRPLPYRIAKAPTDGYDVVRRIEWVGDFAWPGPDHLVVLRRRETPAAPVIR